MSRRGALGDDLGRVDQLLAVAGRRLGGQTRPDPAAARGSVSARPIPLYLGPTTAVPCPQPLAGRMLGWRGPCRPVRLSVDVMS